MDFQPSREQLDMLNQNMRDVEEIGQFAHYPRVKMTPLTEVLSEMGDMIEPNDCYNNALRVLAFLDDEQARYCAGVAITPYGMTVPHAWIKTRDKYHDPSWEKGLVTTEDYTYFVMAELNREQVFQMLVDNDMNAPCALAVKLINPQFLLEVAA
jgi:hypothetical protein